MSIALLVSLYLLTGVVVAWFQKVENLVPVVKAVVTWPAIAVNIFKKES
jgi:hypothetical protein